MIFSNVPFIRTYLPLFANKCADQLIIFGVGAKALAVIISKSLFVVVLGLIALFLISAYNKIFSIDGTMSWMEGFGVPGFLLYPTIAVEIILPLFVIIGYQARISAGLLAIFCIATAFLFHYDFVDQMQTIAFLKNLGLAGGFLFIVVNGTKDWSINREKKYVRL